MSKTLEEILTMYPLQYFSKEERKEIEVLIKTSFQAGQVEGMKGKVFSQVKITEEVNIPKEIHDKIFQAGKDSMKEEIFSKLPPKDKAKWGSENQTDYVQYEHGFNSCLSKVKEIFKNI